MRRLLILAPAAALLAAVGVFPSTVFASSSPILYSSLAPTVAAQLLPSESYEATQTSEFGNEVTLTHSGQIASVTVTMDSWGCGQSGGWSTDNCVTTPGTKFTEPITLNIYQAPATNPTTQPDTVGSGLPGSTILSVTKTFSIPDRPSANNAKCQGTSPYAGSGAWFDSKLGECFAGLATNITFNLTSLHVTLPQTIVFGIAYNTSDYGSAPYGDGTVCHGTSEGCGYDSLNLGLSNDPNNLNRGSDTYTGYIWQNTLYAPYYCDLGVAGTGTFRIDSPGGGAGDNGCWAEQFYGTDGYYVPAIQFKTTT